MLATKLLAALLGAVSVAADPFQKYSIAAEGINASFIGYGARLTNLLVPDRTGKMQDIAVGYDNGSQYLTDTETYHTYFGAVVGRYANRIKNGTFTVQGVTSHIPENEHGGLDTLHGGFVGYDQRNWTLVAYNSTCITFSLLDRAQQGFPGTVVTYATYCVAPHQWTSRLVSIPLDAPTPIILANHVYWNLDAFTSGANSTILNDTLSMPYSARTIDTDGILVPTGGLSIVNGTPYDFYSAPKLIGKDILSADHCGTGCIGYDNAFIMDRPRYSGPEANDLVQLVQSSPITGIQMSIRTNQGSFQMYSCNGENGTIPVKASQQHAAGGATSYVQKYGCVVYETQQWIDGINNPQWGQDQYQVYTPQTEPAVNFAQYDFSVVP